MSNFSEFYKIIPKSKGFKAYFQRHDPPGSKRRTTQGWTPSLIRVSLCLLSKHRHFQNDKMIIDNEYPLIMLRQLEYCRSDLLMFFKHLLGTCLSLLIYESCYCTTLF